MEHYSAIEKNEIMSFATTWMNLKIIILSEVSQRKTSITYMWNLKKKKIQMNLFINRNRLTDIENNLMVTKGEGGGKN